jgi:hypothetical protein
MMARTMRAALLILSFTPAVCAQPAREEALAAMKKAARFYADSVATKGGYHFSYADDLSYGRSEQSEGPTQIEVQREGTPRVGFAFLEAYDATADRAFLDAAVRAGEALIAGQLCSGGWDYIVEFDPAKRKDYPYRTDKNCTNAKRPTTLDDNVTQAATRLMMRIDRALGFKNSRIHEAARFALDSLEKAQYPNGAWPQRFTAPPDPAAFPVIKASYPEKWPWKWPGASYYTHYTFNDNSIADAIDTMLEAARIYGEPRYLASAKRGGDFILLAQMPEPQPAWAQQYDINMQPAWARLFEPPSVTGGESQGILRILMVLYRETGDKKYLDAVRPALEWLEKSVLPPVENPSEIRRRVGRRGPVLARFYELKTNRPLYVTKGTQVSAKGLGSARIDGYELSYSDASVITHYSVLVSGAELPELRREYERLSAGKPSRRPDKLHGLSPWSEYDESGPLARTPTADEVATLITSMDDRGAWSEQGTIGKADQVASVFAAGDMVLTINGRPTPLKENDRVAVFRGALPPRTRIIRSTTFARNLETLAAYVAARK